MKKILSLMLLLTLCFTASLGSFASTESEELIVQPNSIMGYSFGWEITSITPSSYLEYGDWRTGPSGRGPNATIALTNGSSYNLTYTASISGQYGIGEGTIGSELGISIGKAVTYDANYSISIPTAQVRTIIYRPKVRVYTVVSTFYQKDTMTGEKTYLSSETSYVRKFVNWDYSYHVGY